MTDQSLDALREEARQASQVLDAKGVYSTARLIDRLLAALPREPRLPDLTRPQLEKLSDALGYSIEETFDQYELIRETLCDDTRAAVPEDRAAGGDWVLMPRALTAKNGAKAALIGEFRESYRVWDGENEATCTTPISWTTIKEIYKRAVELFATSAPEARGGLIERARKRIQVLEAASRIAPNEAIGSTMEADADMIRDLLAALSPRPANEEER